MDSFVHSGRAIDYVLGLMGIEVIILILVRNKGAPLFRPGEVLASIGAGGALLFALRGALHDFAWQRVAAWLVVALLFHVWDLALRWSMHRTR